MPQAVDQFAWERWVCKLSVGLKPIPRKKLSAERLVGAIIQALGQEMRQAPNLLGEKIRRENGVETAARIIAACFEQESVAQTVSGACALPPALTNWADCAVVERKGCISKLTANKQHAQHSSCAAQVSERYPHMPTQVDPPGSQRRAPRSNVDRADGPEQQVFSPGSPGDEL